MFFLSSQCDSDEREDVGSTGHHAISGHGAEDNRVTAVEQAAVPRHDVTGIFGGNPRLMWDSVKSPMTPHTPRQCPI